MSLSFDARPWFGVSAATWNAKPAATCEASARAPVLAVSGEDVQYPSLLRAHRAAPRWLGLLRRYKKMLHRWETFPFDARLRATSQLPSPTPSRLPRVKQTHARCFLLSLGRRRSTRFFCVRAPRRAGCGRLGYEIITLHQREAGLRRHAPVCDVPAAASNAKPAAVCEASARALALLVAVSGEGGQHSRILRARAAPRWLWSV